MKAKRSILTVAVLASAIGLTAIGVHSTATAVPNNAGRIEGSWRITAQVPDGAGGTTTAYALATFSYDGGIVETPQEKFALSNGHGAWENLGNRYYDSRVVYFRHDDLGVVVGLTEARAQVRVNPSGHWFSGRFRLYTSDIGGKLEKAGVDGLVTGERITVE